MSTIENEHSARLKNFIREHSSGGCKMFSKGSDCLCPLCDVDALRGIADEWKLQQKQAQAALTAAEATIAALQSGNQRMNDLAMHCRAILHEDGLITDQEYADLTKRDNNETYQRIKGYDATIAELRAEVERLRAMKLPMGDDSASQQARAWEKVYEALRAAGVESFVGTMVGGSAQRSVERKKHEPR